MRDDFFQRLSDVSLEMAQIRALEPLLEYALGATLDLVDAERGHVVLLDADGEPDRRVGLDRQGQRLEDAGTPVVQSILDQVLATGDPLVLADAGEDTSPQDPAAPARRSVACVPLTTPRRALGAMCVEVRPGSVDLEPLGLLAAQAAVSIENAMLNEALEARAAEWSANDERLRQEIATRQETGEILAWETAANASLARLSEMLISSESIEAISTLVLDLAKHLTGSALGYIGYIDPQTGHLVIPAMIRDDWDACQVPDREPVSRTFGGLEKWALAHRRPRLVNSPENEPEPWRLPAGHLPIFRILSVPALIGGSMVGQVALANSNRDYTEQDRVLVQRLATLYALAIQRQRTEAALLESKSRLALAIDATDAAVFERVMDYQSVYVSPRWIEILGYTPVDFPPADQAWGWLVDQVHPEDRADMLQDYEDFVRGRVERYRSEFRVRHRTGRWMWVQLTGKAMARDEQGRPVGFTGLLFDVTERKQAEESLHQAMEEAEESRRAAEAANRAKSVFLANMSHELRTPLNAILGFSELMTRDPNLTPSQQDNLATINRSGEHLLALVNDVLELSKIEAGRIELQETDFDLHHLLQGLEEMFRLRAERRGVRLTLEQDPGVPRYVRADENKLRQVLINLLGNAVKFTEKGDVTLKVKTQAPSPKSQSDLGFGIGAAPCGWALGFEVEDTGVGIAPGELEGVFDTFVQTSSGQRLQEGTGLGLPISRQFVRIMGGDLTIRSQEGQGTVLRFSIPVQSATPDDVEMTDPARRAVGVDSDLRAPDGGPYRLLVAEDVDANRELLVRLLKSLAPSPLSFDIREAVNGQEAISIWEQWAPHLIWMDVRMPVMDGLAATRHIKDTPQGRDTIVVALTAGVFEEQRAEALVAGCDDFVRKPLRAADVSDVLTRHLQVRFSYEDPRPQRREDQVADTLQALRDMPAAWRADLHRATLAGDLARMTDLIEQARRRDAALADVLMSLADDFEHDRILALIKQAASA